MAHDDNMMGRIAITKRHMHPSFQTMTYAQIKFLSRAHLRQEKKLIISYYVSYVKRKKWFGINVIKFMGKLPSFNLQHSLNAIFRNKDIEKNVTKIVLYTYS